MQALPRTASENADTVVSKAVIRAADRLGLNSIELGRILGLSPATVSRLKGGAYLVRQGTKEFEFAVLIARLYRGIDAIVGGDDTVAGAWMRSDNTALHGKPVDLVQNLTGLADVIRYLDSRRAPI